MKGFVKFVALVGVIFMVEVSVLATATWVTVRSIDWGTVDLHDRHEGVRVRIPFPASALTGSMSLASNHVRFDVDDDRDREMFEAIADMADDIADAPDMKILELEENDGKITIRKVDGKIRIEVREHDGDVVITLPESSVKSVARTVKRVSEDF